MNLVYSFKATHDIKWAMVFFKDTFFEPAKMIIVSPKFHVEHSDEIIKLGLIPLITPHWPGETYRLASFENLTDAWGYLRPEMGGPMIKERSEGIDLKVDPDQEGRDLLSFRIAHNFGPVLIRPEHIIIPSVHLDPIPERHDPIWRQSHRKMISQLESLWKGIKFIGLAFVLFFVVLFLLPFIKEEESGLNNLQP